MKVKVHFDGTPISIAQESSSKGNQPKWFYDGYWYKADHMGYEGLSEVFVSRLLAKTNIDYYVPYDVVAIDYDNKELLGCRSKTFRNENESLYTLEKLFRSYRGVSLAQTLASIDDVRDRIQFTVDFIEKYTKLHNAGSYIRTMIEIDTFFLNEDRHTNNIAFIRNDNTGVFRYCPYFDFGLSLLSDIKDYPIGSDLYSNINRVASKPFSFDFDTQIDAAEELFGTHLKIAFTDKDVLEVADELSEYYPDEIITRVADIISARRMKYKYLR